MNNAIHASLSKKKKKVLFLKKKKPKNKFVLIAY